MNPVSLFSYFVSLGVHNLSNDHVKPVYVM